MLKVKSYKKYRDYFIVNGKRKKLKIEVNMNAEISPDL